MVRSVVGVYIKALVVLSLINVVVTLIERRGVLDLAIALLVLLGSSLLYAFARKGYVL